MPRVGIGDRKTSNGNSKYSVLAQLPKPSEQPTNEAKYETRNPSELENIHFRRQIKNFATNSNPGKYISIQNESNAHNTCKQFKITGKTNVNHKTDHSSCWVDVQQKVTYGNWATMDTNEVVSECECSSVGRTILYCQCSPSSKRQSDPKQSERGGQTCRNIKPHGKDDEKQLSNEELCTRCQSADVYRPDSAHDTASDDGIFMKLTTYATLIDKRCRCCGGCTNEPDPYYSVTSDTTSNTIHLVDDHHQNGITHMPSNCVGCVEQNVSIGERRMGETISKQSTNSADERPLFDIKSTEEDTLNFGIEHKIPKDKAQKEETTSQRNQKHEGSLDVGQSGKLTNTHEELGSQLKVDRITSIGKLDREKRRKTVIKMYNTQMTSTVKSKTIRWKVGQKLTLNKTNKSERIIGNKVAGQKLKDKTMKTIKETPENRQELKCKEEKLKQHSRKDDKYTATLIDNTIKNAQNVAKITGLEMEEHLRNNTNQKVNLLESIKPSCVTKPDNMELERVSQLNREQGPLHQRNQHWPNPAPASAGSQSVACDLLVISIIDSTISWPVQIIETDEPRGSTGHVKEMQHDTPALDMPGTSSPIGLHWQKKSGSGNLVAIESTTKETAKNGYDHSDTIELQQPLTIAQSESSTPQTGVTECAVSRVPEWRLAIPLTCSEFFVPLQSHIEFIAEFLQRNVLTIGTGTKSVSPSSFVCFIVTQPVLRSSNTRETVEEGKTSSYLEESTVNGNLISDGRHADNSLCSPDVHHTFDEISPIVDLSVRQSKHQRASSVCLPLPDMFGTKLYAARHSKSSVSSHFPDDCRSRKSHGKLITTGQIRTSVSSFRESASVSNRDREMTHSKDHLQRSPEIQMFASSLSGTKGEMDLKEKKSELQNPMPNILITADPTEEVLDSRNQNEELTMHSLADATIETESNSKKNVNSVASENNRLKFQRINTRRLWNVPSGAYARYSIRAKRKILAALRRARNATKRLKISETDKRNASHFKPETRCISPSGYTLSTHEASSEMIVAGGEPNVLECSEGNQHEEDEITQKYVMPQTDNDGGDGTEGLVASCKIHDTTKPVTPTAETVRMLHLEPETHCTTPNGYTLSTHESISEMAVVGEKPDILGPPYEAYIDECADEKINTRSRTKDYCTDSSRLDNLEMMFVENDGKVLASHWGLRSSIPEDKNVSVNKTEAYTTESIWKDKLNINKILLPSNEEAIQDGGQTDKSKSNMGRIAEIVRMGSFEKSMNERQRAFKEAFSDAHTSAIQLLIKSSVCVTNTGFTDVLVKKSNKQQVVSCEPTSSSNKQTSLPKMYAELSPTLYSTETPLLAGPSFEFDDHLTERSISQEEMSEDKHTDSQSKPKDSRTGNVASKNELEYCLFRPSLEPAGKQHLSTPNIHSRKRKISSTPQVTSPPSVQLRSSPSLRKSYKREYQALSKTTKQLDPIVIDDPYSQRAVCHHLLISSNFGRCNQYATSSPYQRLTQNACMTPTNLDISLHMSSEETLSDEIGCEVNSQPEKHDTLNSKIGLSHSGYPLTFNKNIVTSSCMSPSLTNPETPEARQSPTTTSVHETDGLSVSTREALLKSTSNSPGRGGSLMWNGSLCSSPGLPAVTCGSPHCKSVAFEHFMPNDYNVSDLSEAHHRSGDKQPQGCICYEGAEYDITGKRMDALSCTGCGAICKRMHKYQSRERRGGSHHKTCCHQRPHHCPCLEPLTYPAGGCACRRACSLMRVQSTNRCACSSEFLCKPHCAHTERCTKRAGSRICCVPYVCSRSPASRFLPALCASRNRRTCHQRCRATDGCTAHKLVSTAQLKQTTRAESNSYENNEPESHWTANIAMRVKRRPSGRLLTLPKVPIPPTVSAEQMMITDHDSTVKRDKNARGPIQLTGAIASLNKHREN